MVGRLSTGFLAHIFGVAELLTIAVGCCAAIAMGMIGLKDIAGATLIAVLFGYFAGLCEQRHYYSSAIYLMTEVLLFTDVALSSPIMIELTDDFSEIG